LLDEVLSQTDKINEKIKTVMISKPSTWVASHDCGIKDTSCRDHAAGDGKEAEAEPKSELKLCRDGESRPLVSWLWPLSKSPSSQLPCSCATYKP